MFAMKGELEIMGINHQADFQISRHAPVLFSEKRMKLEESGQYLVRNEAAALSPQDCFEATGGQIGWILSESSELGQPSSVGLTAVTCQESNIDVNSIKARQQSLQFADTSDRPDCTRQVQCIIKNSPKLKSLDSKLAFTPQLRSPSMAATRREWNASTDLNTNRSHYYEELSTAPADQDQSWPLLGVSIAKGLGNLGACHDASCMEQLLLHCSSALENNDVTLAQQIMWVLNNIASAEGDPNQRVTSCFLRALIARAARMSNSNMLRAMAATTANAHVGDTKRLSVIELAGFVDLTPWHRFGFSSSNGAIAEAVEGYSVVHILDFGIAHCMQWPTLIDSLSKRPDGPPYIRLTVSCARPPVPPLLNMSYEELGTRLSNFARSRNVPFEFRAIPPDPSEEFLVLDQLEPSILDIREGEALVINCQFRLHYIPDETADQQSSCSSSSCQRDEFLRIIRSFEPTIMTLVDEDSNLTSTSLVSRLKSAFNYLWIPFDALNTFLPRDSKQRQQYESDVGYKIENIIAFEGHQRIERLESKAKWTQRMRKACFQSISFSEDTVAEVKSMLDEHAAGWGLKKEEDDLLLTWKGHNVVFATAWVPSHS